MMIFRKVHRTLRHFKPSRKKCKVFILFCCSLTFVYVTTFNQNELLEESERADFYQKVHATNETPSDYFIDEDYKAVNDEPVKIPQLQSHDSESLDYRRVRAAINTATNGSTVMSICCSDFHQSPYTHGFKSINNEKLPKRERNQIDNLYDTGTRSYKEEDSPKFKNRMQLQPNFKTEISPVIVNLQTNDFELIGNNPAANQHDVSTSTIIYDKRYTFGLLIDELTTTKDAANKVNNLQRSSLPNQNKIPHAYSKLKNLSLNEDLSRWKNYLSLSEDDPRITNFPLIFDNVQSKSKNIHKNVISSYADITRNTIRPIPKIGNSKYVSYGHEQTNNLVAENNEKTTRKTTRFDYFRPAYFPWRTTSDECSHYPTRFLQRGSFPITALVSIPGSGNCWIRYIIEVLTGIFTGSVYADEQLAKKGFWGERDAYTEGTTIVQKFHNYPVLPEDPNSIRGRIVLGPSPRKVVLLVRNPFDAMVSLRHYHAAGHLGIGHQSAFEGGSWHNWTIARTKHWLDVNKAWITLPKTNVYVVHYEKLQNNLGKEAENLLRFLEIPLDYGRLSCLLRYSDGLFKRPHYRRNGMYVLSRQTEKLVVEVATSLNELLRQYNHTQLPFHLYDYPLYTKLRY